MKKGDKVFVESVTYHIGRVVKITTSYVFLDQVTRVYRSGALSACLVKGQIEQKEAIPASCWPLRISRGSITRVMTWPHELP